MKDMNNECYEYTKNVAIEFESYYNGEKVDEDGLPLSFCDYMDKVLDYDIILTSTKYLKGLRLYVALGGPTCWIDTEWGVAICTWGTERAEYYIGQDITDDFNSVAAEMLELDY